MSSPQVFGEGVVVDYRGSLARRSKQPGYLKRSGSTPEHNVLDPPAKIVIGVCAMDKKARSKPMMEILSRMLSFNEFEVANFGDEVILHKPVEEWPKCDCLLSWHSDGFPLSKAQEYVRLRHPFCVNDLHQQEVLLDRRKVYLTLKENSIPVPQHIMVDRGPDGSDPPGFVEDPDYVELNGVRIQKPFVEKPVSGEDHNIYIYYPHSMGGGVKRLFRKVDNKSADYDPNHPGTVRRDGSYIYEEFLTTGGTDVKVYTVGPRYAHAEARKSPVVDGKVQRAADGKEVRYPVLLSPQEKEISRMVCLAFGQKVCGFDLLRSEKGKSYVCDVNGWSFVKNSSKYYDDAAGILRSIILNALAPHRLSTLPLLQPAPIMSLKEVPGEGGEGDEAANLRAVSSMAEFPEDKDGDMYAEDGDPNEELRCVLAVIRHGDRTPKQKLKLVITQPPLLSLFDKYRDTKGKQAKMKTPPQLQEFLQIVRDLQSHLDKAAAALERAGSPPGSTADMSTSTTTPAGQPLGTGQGGAPPAAAPAGATEGAAGSEAEPTAQAQDGATTEKGAAQEATSTAATGGEAPAGGSQEGGVSFPIMDPVLGNIKDRETLEELRDKLRIVKQVLEQGGGQFSGVNRKVQLKPLSWARPLLGGLSTKDLGALPGLGQQYASLASSGVMQAPSVAAAAAAVAADAVAAGLAGSSGAKGGSFTPGDLTPSTHPASGAMTPMRTTTSIGGAAAHGPLLESALLVVKWGGVLTHAGRHQAENLGQVFRAQMYPRHGPAGGGLLRLHSTYRHDLKIYSSDEGRVQVSAAAFTKGLLDLEGTSLTPILVSLVNKDASMLEAYGKGASDEMQMCKTVLYSQLTQDPRKAALPLSPDPTTAVAAAGTLPSVAARSLVSPVPSSPSPPYSPTAHFFSVAPPGLLGPGLLPRQDSVTHAPGHEAVTAAAPAGTSDTGSAPGQAGAGSRLAPPPPVATSPAPRSGAGAHSGQTSHAVNTKDGNEGTLSGWDASNVPTPTRGPTPAVMQPTPSWPQLAGGAPAALAAALGVPHVSATSSAPAHADQHTNGLSRSTSPALPLSGLPSVTPAALVASGGAGVLAGLAQNHAPLPNLPKDPLQLLHRLVDLTREVVDKLVVLARKEQEEGEGPRARPYSSLNQTPEEWVPAPPGKPCSGESMLLLLERWRKLSKALYSPKKGIFDISKIPDIYDSVKHDAIHNAHLGIDFSELYATAKSLADVVIPHEYGLDPVGKLSIGSKIAKELVGKVLCDMASMREESLMTAASWGQEGEEDGTGLVGSGDEFSPSFLAPSHDSMLTEFGAACLEDDLLRNRKGTLSAVVNNHHHGDGRPVGQSLDQAVAAAVAGEGAGTEDSQETETVHRLCPTYASDINSPLRHVRTRIYFTSESHIHSLINVLRFAHLREGYNGRPLVNDDSQALLDATPEFDYLTHIMFRMYENKKIPVDSPARFRVEVQISAGAAYNPITMQAPDHMLPTVPRTVVNLGTADTLSEVEGLLTPFSTPRKVPPSLYALQVALKAPSAPMSRNMSTGTVPVQGTPSTGGAGYSRPSNSGTPTAAGGSTAGGGPPAASPLGASGLLAAAGQSLAAQQAEGSLHPANGASQLRRPPSHQSSSSSLSSMATSVATTRTVASSAAMLAEAAGGPETGLQKALMTGGAGGAAVMSRMATAPPPRNP